MATLEELKLRVRELENELIKCKQKQCAMEDALHRPRIEKMSAEVVDSNPYRWVFNILVYNLYSLPDLTSVLLTQLTGLRLMSHPAVHMETAR